MKQIFTILIIGSYLCLLSCKETSKMSESSDAESEFIQKIRKVSDSIKVGEIVIRNLYKSQILAHQGTTFDSTMIIEKVYNPHQKLWDNCYAMIFGEDNSSKFNTPEGMVEWNRTLYPENKTFFDQRAAKLIDMNLDSIFKKNLARLNKMVPFKIESEISILFTPIQGILFGGCEVDEFCLELNHKEDVNYVILKGLPHELNHLAYEPLRESDFKKDTALRQTIDEGFACYFTWVFFNGKISKHEAVENMSTNDWNWYLANEREIFNKTKPYFEDESGDNPLLRNDKLQIFKDAPKSLNYWLGFRIIEKYVEKNGVDSWKDIYEMDVDKVLKESEYEDFINTLH